MRKRSVTIEAETIEEFTQLAIQTVYKKAEFAQKYLARPRLGHTQSCLEFSKSPQSDSVNSNGQENGTSNEKSSSPWDDFDYVDENVSIKSPLKLPEPEQSVEEDTDNHKKCFKCMVMGNTGSGRHEILNSMFESEDVALKQSMDLVVKVEEEEQNENVYQFWIQSLNDHKYDVLIKFYYKSTNVFLFVYSITDRSTFLVLDEAISVVKTESPKEKFVGILIGTNLDSDAEREVSKEEAEELKDKHKLAMHIEANNENCSSMKHSLEELLKSHS